MDSFEINKIVGAILLVALLVIGIGKLSDVIFHVEKPKTPSYAVDVEEATIREPFSKSREPLFQDITPCCIHFGRFSYASCSLERISLAVAALFASIATLICSLNRT